jgi:hypothetical protein
MDGWIGVDFDGTLVEYTEWKGVGNFGAPIKLMVDRVKKWLKDGKKVKIFTARADNGISEIIAIEAWCKEYLGIALPITNVKDFNMISLWDDRCVTVETNTGEIIKSKIEKEL